MLFGWPGFFAALRACDFIAKPAVFSLNLTLKTVSIRRFLGIYSQALGMTFFEVTQWSLFTGMTGLLRWLLNMCPVGACQSE